MTSKEALEIVKDYLLPKLKEDNSELGSIIIVESVNVLEDALTELERLKKFKETFDNYELVKKQDFIAYENWIECEKELEELKQEVITQQEKKDKLLELYKQLNIIYEKLYTMELSELSLNSNYYEIEIIKLKHQIKEKE